MTLQGSRAPGQKVGVLVSHLERGVATRPSHQLFRDFGLTSPAFLFPEALLLLDEPFLLLLFLQPVQLGQDHVTPAGQMLFSWTWEGQHLVPRQLNTVA